jgi:RimJ/RimL family protein N-acetyltransferase
MSADGSFPDLVPVLVDPVAGVLLRAHRETDIPGIIEQCRDPETIRWTTVPSPAGGYGVDVARAFLGRIPYGWEGGGPYVWAIELLGGAGREPVPFAGSIDLHPREPDLFSVGFGLHPAARGHGVMTAALRLVRDHAFDVLGVRAIRGQAVIGNWGSRRTAAAAGFRFDGSARCLLSHRGELLDGWQATMTADDPRGDLRWPPPPTLVGDRLTLRPFSDGDLDRIVEACADPVTAHWLVSLPQPYDVGDAVDYLEGVREMAARRTGWAWCVADAEDRCLGAVSLEGFGGYARRLEIGYWAHPEARGRGMITEAVRTVTAHVEDRDLADSVIIRCAAGNASSRRVAEAAGYVRNGVQPASEPLGDGSLDDLLLYTRSRRRREVVTP